MLCRFLHGFPDSISGLTPYGSLPPSRHREGGAGARKRSRSARDHAPISSRPTPAFQRPPFSSPSRPSAASLHLMQVPSAWYPLCKCAPGSVALPVHPRCIPLFPLTARIWSSGFYFWTYPGDMVMLPVDVDIRSTARPSSFSRHLAINWSRSFSNFLPSPRIASRSSQCHSPWLRSQASKSCRSLREAFIKVRAVRVNPCRRQIIVQNGASLSVTGAAGVAKLN